MILIYEGVFLTKWIFGSVLAAGVILRIFFSFERIFFLGGEGKQVSEGGFDS